jgi:hypothetical protein
VSIFTNGPHTVTVYLEEEVTDSRGNRVRRPSDTGVVVAGCLVHPVASTRGAFPAIDVRQGQKVDASWKLVCRVDTPLGWWSRVVWTAAGGAPEPEMTFTVLGGPLRRNVTAATAHITCTLQEVR